jgi:hypothetical protein
MHVYEHIQNHAMSIFWESNCSHATVGPMTERLHCDLCGENFHDIESNDDDAELHLIIAVRDHCALNCKAMMVGNNSDVKVPYISTLHRPACGERGTVNLKWLAGVVKYWRQNAGIDEPRAKVNLHHDWQGLDMFDTHGNVPYTCTWPELDEMKLHRPARSNFPNQDPYHNKQLKKIRITLENQSQELIHTCNQTLQKVGNVKGIHPRDVLKLKEKTETFHTSLMSQRVLQDTKRRKITPQAPLFPPPVPSPSGAVQCVSDDEVQEEEHEQAINRDLLFAPWKLLPR